jgi:hypothetical protein
MNALQKISSNAAKIEREMSPAEYEEFANLYRLVRVELNGLYELLPAKEKDNTMDISWLSLNTRRR